MVEFFFHPIFIGDDHQQQQYHLKNQPAQSPNNYVLMVMIVSMNLAKSILLII